MGMLLRFQGTSMKDFFHCRSMEKYTKVLYCTRHTFINKLYSEKVDENVIRSLIGHEKGFTMKHYGGEPFSPERLLEEISKVSYSKITGRD